MEERLGYELKRAQHALRTTMDAALGHLELTAPQYAVLAVLEAAPGVSSAELARRSFVTPQTMHAIVAGLEARGLLAREARPGQGRVLAAALTREGRARVARGHDAVRVVEEHMTASLDGKELQELFALLRRCAEALDTSDVR
jgi:DNA-binding MarR family transcriptional regulator